MAAYNKSDLERRMNGAVESLKGDLAGLRTGRASVNLLDPVTVEVYGAHMPLNQVATVSAPEPRLLSVQVWDKSNVGPCDKAIRSAGLGLNPIVDGTTLRLPIPDLTEDRRKELAKLAGQYAEKARIAVRNVRRDGMDALKIDEKKHEISEDDGKREGKGNPRQVSAPALIEIKAAGSAPATPRHVAIIMDGNGRWAKARHLPRVAGHRKGIEAVRAVTRAARSLGIEVLTLYAFSSENWRRPAEEISDLMGLLRHFIKSDLEELAREGVRLRVIGDHTAFAPDVVALIDNALARTADNTGSTLVIGLNYGSQDEIVRAARKLAGLDPADIDTAAVEAALDTADLPPVDLLIRTSGEHRLSNFMLWQVAYAELLFVDTLWPDFGADALADAVAAFHRRERRFGGL